MKSVTLIVDQVTGDLTIEGLSRQEAGTLLGDVLSGAIPVNCARPLAPRAGAGQFVPGARALRLHRVYHGSVVDGPGRRSVLQVQGCPLRCPGFIYSMVGVQKGGEGWQHPRPARAPPMARSTRSTGSTAT